MGFIKKLGIFFLSVISILLIILLSFSFALNSFLYPEVYFQALEKSGIYGSIQDSMGSEELFFVVMPQGGSKELVENLFSNFMAYLRSETDFLELKVQIDQEKLRNFFLEQIGPLSQCTGNQNPFNDENPCLPKGMSSESYLDAYLKSENLQFFNETEVDLVNIYGIQEGSEGRVAIDGLREKISYLKTAYLIIVIVLLIIISLIFLIQKPNTKKFLRTISLITIIPSFILYFIIYFLSILRTENIIPMFDMFSLSIYDAVKDVLSSKLTLCIVILLVTGVTLTILSFIIKPKKDKKL